VVDGEAVLLHADTSAYFGLNRTGTLLWAALADEGVGSQRLLAWARSSFPDAPPGLSDDVSSFLSQLAGFDLLEPTTPDAEPETPGSSLRSAPAGRYEPPTITPFGELEKLILSGE
jgi:hypothetical protein